MTDDTCIYCGAPYRRTRSTQRYCSRQCGGRAFVQSRHEDVCDCGQPVTQRLWVLQLTGEGWTTAQQMALCDACAALMPEGTAERPQIADHGQAFREPARSRPPRDEFEDEYYHRVRVVGGLKIR